MRTAICPPARLNPGLNPARRGHRRIVAALALLAGLAGCGPEPQLSISDAWVRLAAVPGRPAAAYFTIHGGPTDATLVNVTTDVAIRSEMHETRAAAGGRGMTMAAIRSVPVAALGTVRFAPGGKHVMLFELNPVVKAGGSMTFTFTFANAVRIQQDALVIAAGDPAPKT